MRRLWIGLMLMAWAAGAVAQNGAEAAIRAVLTAQEAAWNRGDIKTFMQGYENSPQTTFIGAEVRHGYEPILRRYLEAYTSRAQMGTLTFSDVAVRPLPASCGAVEYAIVTGRFHLERSEKGSAKKDDGVFSLVWHKGAGGWKIVLDHTS
ncbi:MAG: YybH family protein [Acidobacteriota bacterium]